MSRSAALLVAGLGCAGLAAFGWQGRISPTTADHSNAPLSGMDLFLAKGCARCHIGPADPSSATQNAGSGAEGPSLANASVWASERVAGLRADAYLDQSIRDPSLFRSPLATGGVMPGLVVSDAEIDALVDYLLQG